MAKTRDHPATILRGPVKAGASVPQPLGVVAISNMPAIATSR